MTYYDIKYKKFVSQRRFGVELETGGELSKAKVKLALKKISERKSLVSKYQLSEDSSSWHIKDDATCGPIGRLGAKGVEIASFVGKGIEDLKHISDVAEFLHKAGCRVNNNCGLHIHAEARDLTIDQVGSLVAHWVKIEPIISMSLPISRLGNPYCNFCRSIILNKSLDLSLKRSAKEIWEIFKPNDLSYYENEDRRFTLNLVNYARAIHYDSGYRKTLELRWPEGTLNGRDIRCWVRLFLNFIDTCKNLPVPTDLHPYNLEEVLMCLGLNHDKNSFTIFSEGLHDTKTWFLERILTNFSFSRKIWYSSSAAAFLPKKTIQDAKKTLDLMWSPIKKYA